jgi:hypothetical protein
MLLQLLLFLRPNHVFAVMLLRPNHVVTVVDEVADVVTIAVVV